MSAPRALNNDPRSATELEEPSLGFRRRHRGGSLVGARCFIASSKPFKQIRSGGVEHVVVVQAQRTDQI